MDETSLSQQQSAQQRTGQTRRRLRAIEGQTHGLIRMLDEGRPAVDVLGQIAAVQEALAQVSKIVLRSVLENSARLAHEATTAEEAAIIYEDLLDIIYKYRR